MALSNPIPELASALVAEAHSLRREFRLGSSAVSALRGVDLSVGPGERVAIMGPSGCGKSTLLSLIGGLDRPTSGTVILAGQDLSAFSRTELAHLRRACVGYVPQSAALLPMLTVAENVELPLALLGEEPGARAQRVHDLLERVELADKAQALPEELSGGQQQRVAIARALAARPRIVLADEPTGSLDSVTAQAILRLMVDEAARERAAILMVTHEEDEAQYADRVVQMRDGLILVGEETR
jgi:putative ABC transport system ATP-binding protein